MSARIISLGLTPEALERWRKSPASFIEAVLHNPETGKPFVLFPAERRFLKHAFKTDRHGKLCYPEQVYSCPKKSGKTCFSALHCLTTTLLFGGHNAEAICLANDEEQSVGRVFEAVKKIVAASPLLKAEAKITASKITFPAIGATIIALANDYAGAAGSNAVFVNFDELWGFRSERSRRLWDEMVPPPTRKISLRLVTSYAGYEDSALLAELHKHGTAQPQVGPDLYAGNGQLTFWTSAKVAPWQTETWREQMRRQMRPLAFARMIENQFVSTESSFVDLDWWDRCVDSNRRPILEDKSFPVWVGVDASVKFDQTALVAVTFADRKVVLVNHRIFQPSPKQPLDFEGTIERTLRDWSRRFNIRGVHYDPHQMQAVAQRLRADGIPMREYVQTVANLVSMGACLYERIKTGTITTYPDPQIRKSIAQTVAKETPLGIQLVKTASKHKIDVVVALAMAALHAVEQGARMGQPIHYVPGLTGKIFDADGMVLGAGSIYRYGGLPANHVTPDSIYWADAQRELAAKKAAMEARWARKPGEPVEPPSVYSVFRSKCFS
jgi:hypothetical protein